MITSPLARVKLALSDPNPTRSDTSHPEPKEKPTAIIPVPAGVEPVEHAAARLMKRPADFIWQYLDDHGRLLFAVARWNEKDDVKTFRPSHGSQDLTGGRSGHFSTLIPHDHSMGWINSLRHRRLHSSLSKVRSRQMRRERSSRSRLS
jgi:hypothetical protein